MLQEDMQRAWKRASCTASAHCRMIWSMHGKDMILKESFYVHFFQNAPGVATSVHGSIIEDKQAELISRRLDQSVPSPGAGHGH